MSIPFLLPVALFLVLWALCSPLAGVVRAIKAAAKRESKWILRTRVEKWIAKHPGPLGPYAPVLAVVAAGAVAAVCAGVLFIELAEQIDHATSIVSRADQAIHTWFGQERADALTTLFTGATHMGSTIGLTAIVTAVAAGLLVRKDRSTAIFLVTTASVGSLLNLGLKLIFERVRPDLASALVAARWYSFPSGHAMDTCITYGAVAYVALRQPWPWAARSASLASALTIVALVGVSRVYLGVHWASDILGGWSAATVWLATNIVALEMLQHRRRIRHARGTPHAHHAGSVHPPHTAVQSPASPG